ncbi:hypothetical protein KAW64_02770 [bacterium]|nr:hypothetical protein [bacterium]
MFTNADLIARVNAAIKGVIEPSDMGSAVLQTKKAARFIRRMEYDTTVLPVARFIEMDSPVEEIDEIGFASRILTAGHTTSDAHRNLSDSEFSEPTVDTQTITAKELQAVASLRDKTLRRSIERGTLEDTIIDLLGEAAGRDLEEYAFFADTSTPFATDAFIHQGDGWLREAGSKVYGIDVAGQVGKNFDAAGSIELMFQAMIDALPKRFLGSVKDWHIFVTYEMFDDYLDILRAKATDLGDKIQEFGAGRTTKWKGFNITWVPLLERYATTPVSDAEKIRDRIEGQCALLTHPENLAWGVLHSVQIEPEREAKKRRTDFVLTFEGDAGYQRPDAAVAAFTEKANPASP